VERGAELGPMAAAACWASQAWRAPAAPAKPPAQRAGAAADRGQPIRPAQSPRYCAAPQGCGAAHLFKPRKRRQARRLLVGRKGGGDGVALPLQDRTRRPHALADGAQALAACGRYRAEEAALQVRPP
jgi:hypothetical protein